MDRTSPIKDKPLRLPAQSLMEERAAIWEDRLEPWALVALLALALSAMEWVRFLTDSKPSPILFTVVASIATGFAAWRFTRELPRVRRLRLAIDGEKAVGQFLERLRGSGYVVFHDVVGPNFNIDHVLVGLAGVFTVETKTWSKPKSGSTPTVSFDGTTLRAGALALERDPVAQVQAQASWLRRVLSETTGREFRVFPILLFPGWYVEQDTKSRLNFWLLEPKALPAFLTHEPERLSPEDQKLIVFHLSRFIRSTERLGR